ADRVTCPRDAHSRHHPAGRALVHDTCRTLASATTTPVTCNDADDTAGVKPSTPTEPTCPGWAAVPSEPGMKSRSPGATWLSPGTGAPSLTWVAVLREIPTRAAAQEAWTSPEQSKLFGPVAPQTYGLPSCPTANASAALAAGSAGSW